MIINMTINLLSLECLWQLQTKYLWVYRWVISLKFDWVVLSDWAVLLDWVVLFYNRLCLLLSARFQVRLSSMGQSQLRLAISTKINHSSLHISVRSLPPHWSTSSTNRSRRISKQQHQRTSISTQFPSLYLKAFRIVGCISLRDSFFETKFAREARGISNQSLQTRCGDSSDFKIERW